MLCQCKSWLSHTQGFYHQHYLIYNRRYLLPPTLVVGQQGYHGFPDIVEQAVFKLAVHSLLNQGLKTRFWNHHLRWHNILHWQNAVPAQHTVVWTDRVTKSPGLQHHSVLDLHRYGRLGQTPGEVHLICNQQCKQDSPVLKISTCKHMRLSIL